MGYLQGFTRASSVPGGQAERGRGPEHAARGGGGTAARRRGPGRASGRGAAALGGHPAADANYCR